jgi:hypothetical protein
LVIDAMDLLHRGRFDGFCLVSSDSDFTRLASRMREQGADVYGFGAPKTPESFRQACRRFIYTENLMPAATAANTDTPAKPGPLRPRSAAIPILKKAISQIESEDGWVPLRQVGSQLSNLFSDFDVRSYGHSKLSDLLRKTEAFDIEKGDGGPRIRARVTSGAQGPTQTSKTTPCKVERVLDPLYFSFVAARRQSSPAVIASSASAMGWKTGGVTPFKVSTVMSNTGSTAVTVSRIASGVHCRIRRSTAPVTTMTRLRDRYTR